MWATRSKRARSSCASTSARPQQALAGSQAQVMQAQAALQNAKANYERARQLFAQKFISQSALDKAQADYEMALAQAAASEAGAGQSAIDAWLYLRGGAL